MFSFAQSLLGSLVSMLLRTSIEVAFRRAPWLYRILLFTILAAPLLVYGVDRVWSNKWDLYNLYHAVSLTVVVLVIYLCLASILLESSLTTRPELIRNLLSQLNENRDFPDIEAAEDRIDRILDCAIAICKASLNSFGEEPAFRASVQLSDGNVLNSFRLREYPPSVPSFKKLHGIPWDVFHSANHKPSCNKYVGDLGKVANFHPRDVEKFVDSTHPAPKSTACLLLEHGDGTKYGVMQIVASKKRCFDEKKVGKALEILAEISTLVLHQTGTVGPAGLWSPDKEEEEGATNEE